MIRGLMFGIAIPLLAGCSAHRAPADAPVPAWSLAIGPSTTDADDVAPAADPSGEYEPIPDDAAAIMGCALSSSSPICAVAVPTAEEDSAFRAEGGRLSGHSNAKCRQLGEAILANESGVRMYRKALIRWSGPTRLYGVGHTYEIDDVWRVRVARRLDDLNERTLAEKLRTLRHEMSHTIGATESSGSGWTAEDYASNCG